MGWIRDIELTGGTFWTGMALAAGLVAAFWLGWLSRLDDRGLLVSRKMARLLFGLRLVAVGLLALLLAEPVMERVILEPAKGRLIVGVDVSASMKTVDRTRPSSESARLAELLKQAGLDPTNVSRREIARGLLAESSAPLAKLANDHELEFFAFAGSTTPVAVSTILAKGENQKESMPIDDGATDWRPLLAEAARPEAPGKPPTVGVVLISDGRFHASPGGRKEFATAGAPNPVAELARRQIPVFPLLVGSRIAPSDLAVVGLQAPETAFLGDSAPVAVQLETNGLAGRDLTITLEAKPPGQPPFITTKTLRSSADHERLETRFEVPLSAPGSVTLSASAARIDGEAREDNNAMARSIAVTGEPARVLVIDGEPRWEFRYLRNALARDTRVKVESVVFQQPKPVLPRERPESVSIGIDPPTYRVTLPGFDQGSASEEAGSDPFDSFDAIVLGDVAPSDVPPGFWERLEAHVAERAGTLIVAPGPRHWASLWGGSNDGNRGAVSRPMRIPAALAPLTGLRLASIAGAVDPARPALPPGVAILPTPEAFSERLAWPMFRLTDGKTASTSPNTDTAGATLWAKLPRQPWVLVGRPKPGASVLAVSALGSDSARGSSSPSNVEDSVVMAAQPFGLGRVFWIGVDGTWRWRYRVGDELHHRFWGQTVRWAASAARLTAGNNWVRFGPTRPRVETGEPARIRARLTETDADHLAKGMNSTSVLAARVSRRTEANGTEGKVAVQESLVELRPLPGQPRTFEGDVPPLAPGHYAVRLETSGLNEDHRARAPKNAEAMLEVIPRATRERVDLAASREDLEPLAQATGGAVIADFEAETLPDRLRPFARKVGLPRARVVPLWDRPLTLILIVAILGAEWALRKRVGLA